MSSQENKGGNLISQIKGEINKTGFPLELKISKHLQKRGMYVTNSIYYVDKDEEKGREMYLRALLNYKWNIDDRNYWVRHCYIIECKKSIDKPWVIFTSNKTGYDPGLKDLTLNWEADEEWPMASHLETIERNHPYFSPKRYGRNYFVPFKKGNNRGAIFDALTTVAKATIATRDNQFAASGSGSICFYYPLVVFEGRLFEAFLDSENQLCIAEEDFITVSFHYQSASYPNQRFLIPIVTESALSGFFDPLQRVLDSIGEAVKESGVLPKKHRKS